jgi:hypothetical protein
MGESDIAFHAVLVMCSIGACVSMLLCTTRLFGVVDQAVRPKRHFTCFVDWEGKPLAANSNRRYPGIDRAPGDEAAKKAANSQLKWSKILLPFLLLFMIINNLIKTISSVLLLLLSIGRLSIFQELGHAIGSRFNAVFSALMTVVGRYLVPLLNVIGWPDLELECFVKWCITVLEVLWNAVRIPGRSCIGLAPAHRT